jgi:ribonuclease J
MRFLGGVAEIGGNKIVIEDGPDRILFDFGPSFSPRFEQFYYNFLQPRSLYPVKDLLEFDLLPRVEGLYSPEALNGSDLAYRDPEFHAVFVSHAHADHAGYLDMIDPTIPVHVSPGTKTILEAIESSGTQKYGEHDWRMVADSDPIKVGNLEVVPFPVDHSIPAARGFVIHTREGAIVYTGDFRMHGPRARTTVDFLAEAKGILPKALIMEGTRAGPDPRLNFSEQGVREGVERVLTGSPHVSIVSCYPRDVDRLTTLYQAAIASDREFVISLRTAHLLRSIAEAGMLPGAPVPGVSPGLRVYLRPKRVYYKWERPFLDDAVDSEFVRRNGPKLLLSLDLLHFAELIDLRPPRGAPFIHSMSEPFSEDDVDDQVLHNWIDHFGLQFHQMHASGHCSGPELGQFVKEMAPRTLFPVHTEHPDLFQAYLDRVIQPKLGATHPLPS